MIPRKTLKRKLSTMSVKKAGEIYKSMTILQAKRKFHCYKDAFKYLLVLAYENANYISSLQLNNKALAKAVQKEKENTALQLKETLLSESRYFDLMREYSILKTKLSSFEQNLTKIDESVKTSMIPNLVRLSDDITTLKLNCDVLRNTVGTTYQANITIRTHPKNNAAERHPRMISDAYVPSPVVEEAEDETILFTARKCKGGLRNAFNTSSLRDRPKKRSLTYTTNLESSFAESSSVVEKKSVTPPEVAVKSLVPCEVKRKSHKSSDVESLQTVPKSPAVIPLSPNLPVSSPVVVIRRVLSPINTSDLNDSVPSIIGISFKDKSPSIIENESCSLTRSEYKRSAHSSYFTSHEENGASRSILTERKKSKRSNFFKKNDESRTCKKSDFFKSSSQLLCEDDDHSNEIAQHRRSKSRRDSSNRENEPPIDNYSLIGERKRYKLRSSSRNSLIQYDDDSVNQSTLKVECKNSMPLNSTFGNETSCENFLNDSRRLRTRSKNVCYKERPLNVKLRKN